MKYYLLVASFIFIECLNASTRLLNRQHEAISLESTSTSDCFLLETGIIDNLDTVVFDLSKAVITSGYIDFPVSILSDDSVYSLDFAFKFNHANLKYDSIFDLSNYLQSLSFYNPYDSTVRFTSNSFQKYKDDTSLVSVRFEMLAGHISENDFSNVYVYLNGAPCSVKIVNSIIDGFIEKDHKQKKINIYPNPSHEHFFINIDNSAEVKHFEMIGKEIKIENQPISDQIQEIKTGKLVDGVYLLIISEDEFHSVMRVVISGK